jgi:tetratricopeptide (TPR) repeat protein
MGAPDLQGIATCSYCGTKIVLPPTETNKELKNLARYKELCQTERQAKNWSNLLKYAEEILEIDPRDLDGWLDKALAGGSLANYLIPRYDEAMGYLQKATDLSPDDVRIIEIGNIIRDTQFNSYVSQAAYLNQEAIGMKRLGSTGREYAVKYTIEAMGYLILAHKIKPDDLQNLDFIYKVKENGLELLIQWNDEVFNILAKAQQLKAKQSAANRLKTLHSNLSQRQIELEKLKQKKRGFFVNMEIEDVEQEIKNIKFEINKLEETAR